MAGLCPSFRLSQNEQYVELRMQVPHLQPHDMECYFGDSEFHFHCHPYSLKLFFQQRIAEDGTEQMKYDVESGELLALIPKANKGEHFEDLQMLTKRLQAESAAERGAAEDAAAGDRVYYGFNQQYSGVFVGLALSLAQLMEIPEPEVLPADQRLPMMRLAENLKWDADHYLADFVDDVGPKFAMAYRCAWERLPATGQEAVNDAGFSEEQQVVLRGLKNKRYLLADEVSVMCGLVDIMYSFCYNELINQGEHNVEAGWNLIYLSTNLSWLYTSPSIEHTLFCSFRRALAYPLYRYWGLCCRVQEAVAALFSAPKWHLLKALLGVHRTFTHNDDKRYLLNSVWINDYLVWVQGLEPAKLRAVAQEVRGVRVEKRQLGWNVAEVEVAAQAAVAQATGASPFTPPSASTAVETEGRLGAFNFAVPAAAEAPRARAMITEVSTQQAGQSQAVECSGDTMKGKQEKEDEVESQTAKGEELNVVGKDDGMEAVAKSVEEEEKAGAVVVGAKRGRDV